ncbi:hypothetical protein GA0070606_2117 [Micromonospora citrea]|uniref:Uncharacterized protein n=1 Tax=Micromonospora citrea TaxID=47855 RepID=A0A1C6UHN5_9ACTN|nr:hypothetical protein [Micromonospora citrea]SCL53419.1 hypothetical protein GA0070606_2117 [Micromonospora citrea]
MTIEDNDVRDVLRRVTDDLAGPPTLLDDVRRGGRRRLRRRRAVLAAVCAAVLAVPVGGAIHFVDSGTGGVAAEVASPLFDAPTRGDLAGDEEYLRQVRQAWRQRAEGMESEGGRPDAGSEPHVVWAGNTPAGPAAYVAQRVTVTRPGSDRGNHRLIGYAGFVEPAASGPRVMTMRGMNEGNDGNSAAVLLGPRRDVLVVLDAGYPVEFSPTFRYAPDGRIERIFQRVTFRDGAAVLPVPPQRDRVTVALVGVPLNTATAVEITNTDDILFPDGKNSPEPRRVTYTLPDAERVWGDDPAARVDNTAHEALAAAYIDVGRPHTDGESPLLVVYGATPDGRRLLLQTVQHGDDPARAIVLLARGDAPLQPAVSGFVDWRAPLPVRLRLPDGQGVLVVAEGAALSYRIGAGRWHDAGSGAALLPADATQVRVATASGTATVRIDS